MTSGGRVKNVKTSKRDTATCESVWEINANYIVPWEVAEDASTLPEHRASALYPGNCGLYSAALASGHATPFAGMVPGDLPVVVSGPSGVASGPGTGVVVAGPGISNGAPAMPAAPAAPATTVTAATSTTTPAATTTTTAPATTSTVPATTTTMTTTTPHAGPAPWDQRQRRSMKAM